MQYRVEPKSFKNSLYQVSKRISRVNELLQREISEQLHCRYRSAATRITISSVETSSDLRKARIYYSVIGEESDIREARALFRRVGKDIHRQVSRHIILKYFPSLEFIHDLSMERGVRMLGLLDQLDDE